MKDRLTVLANSPIKGNVLYISMRDLRLLNNHCIHYAYNLSYHYQSQMFIGVPIKDIKCNDVQYSLILENIEDLRKESIKQNLYLTILDNVNTFVKTNKIKNIILDWSPLREHIAFCNNIKDLCTKDKLFCIQIDSHNIVPCKILDVYKRTSSSVKIQLFKHFFEYLNEYDDLQLEKSVNDSNFTSKNMKFIINAWDTLEPHKFNDKKKESSFKCNIPKYEPAKYYQGTYSAGLKVMDDFFNNKFHIYNECRNNPDVDGLSNLSPYIHLGILSPQKIIKLAYEKFYKKDKDNLDGYVAEIFIWRETSEHFCYHNKDYDNIMGALEWARDSLHEHAKDEREHLYTKEELEFGKTNDSFWNAAENQLLKLNKIHGYVRMYWAKQLVKWTKTPEEAVKIGIELNDKYSIDGNDPNGYTGVMWCICGTMDRGYKDRDITGKIRPLNAPKTKHYEKLWNDEKETEKYLKTKLINRTENN